MLSTCAITPSTNTATLHAESRATATLYLRAPFSEDNTDPASWTCPDFMILPTRPRARLSMRISRCTGALCCWYNTRAEGVVTVLLEGCFASSVPVVRNTPATRATFRVTHGTRDLETSMSASSRGTFRRICSKNLCYHGPEPFRKMNKGEIAKVSRQSMLMSTLIRLGDQIRVIFLPPHHIATVSASTRPQTIHSAGSNRTPTRHTFHPLSCRNTCQRALTRSLQARLDHTALILINQSAATRRSSQHRHRLIFTQPRAAARHGTGNTRRKAWNL